MGVVLAGGCNVDEVKEKHVRWPFILLGMCLVICIISVLVFLDCKGVVINNTQICLHDLGDYKALVEQNIHPVVFAEHNQDFADNFRGVLTEDYVFSMNDLFDRDITLDYTYDYDKDRLSEALSVWNSGAVKSEDAYVDPDREQIVPEVYGTQVDIDAVLAAVEAKQTGIKLSDFYIKPEKFKEDFESCVALLNDCRAWHVGYKDSSIVLTMPKENVVIDRDGQVMIVSKDFIDDFLDTVVDEFNTMGSDFNFVTYSGDRIVVPGKTFGNVVDIDAEREALVDLLEQNSSMDDREPVYTNYMGELADDYIEISIEDQHVWHWSGGEVISESDCVTGCVANRHSTPTGVFYIDMIQNGKMLYPKGETKGSWVNKWMRFTKDGCGLHDATWRSQFGGQIYKTNGSHGCVNLPKAYAYQLFEEVKMGLPVVVY